VITSVRNPHVAYLRSLQRTRRRREEGLFLVEGLRLAQEALNSGLHPRLVLYDPRALDATALGREVLTRVRQLDRSFEAAPHVIAAAADTKTPAGLVMALPVPTPPPLEESLANTPLVLVLDAIADPGNAGTILRSATAAGLTVVIAGPGTVDLFAPKVVRAGMGAHFRLHLYSLDWASIGSALTPFVQIVGASARASQTIYDIDWKQRSALIVGSEAHGLQPAARALLTTTARIPMAPTVESLNAAVATSIILFHARKHALVLQMRPSCV
jgi:TrmH family RNA methyltransferase